MCYIQEIIVSHVVSNTTELLFFWYLLKVSQIIPGLLCLLYQADIQKYLI